MMRACTTLLAALLCLCSALEAQTPQVLLRLDGALNDSSSAAVVTSVTGTRVGGAWVPAAGDYGPDRTGAAGKALIFTGGRSLQLNSSALPGNSNQALGLRNAAGTNTSFTLSAWVLFTSVGGSEGFNTIWGNPGASTGTLRAGLASGSSFTHFGFESNDVTGAVATISPNVWYHIACVYDIAPVGGSATTAVQKIYINGIPEISRYNVTNTLKVADLLLGNFGALDDTSNDFKGRLDDAAVFNVALKGDQILALADGVSPLALPAAGTYSGPKLPGVANTAGNWGVREIKAFIGNNTVNGIAYGTLVNADRIIRSNPTTAQATILDYQSPQINFVDDEGAGTPGSFPNEGDFGTNTGSPDDNLLMVARCAVRIPVAGPWTFGFRGDDGSRLRIIGKQFSSSTRVGGNNFADPAHSGDGIYYTSGTGDSATIGVVTLPAGDYNVELVYWEGSGGSSIEVFAALGEKSSIDGTFQLIGNAAGGGLEIVRDPDTVPTIQQFSANASSSIFVHSGVPAEFTLAWQTNIAPISVSIDQGIGTVGQSGSLVLPVPTQTTVYTITATAGADVATRTVTVYVDAPPIIQSLAVSDSTVVANGIVTVSWAVAGASSLTLNPGGFDVTGTTSNTVTVPSTTTYTLTATNVAGNVQQSVEVLVGPAPVVGSFTAADPSLQYGADTTLNWNVTNATTVTITPDVGTVGLTGSAPVAPLVTTSYQLRATNQFGAITRSVTVTQVTPIGVTSAGFSARRVTASTPFPFAGQGYLQSADTLLSTGPAGTTVNGYTTVNFIDGADGDFASGAAFPGGGGDNFAVRITATLVVNTPGDYTFVVNCDDGARLRIDGQDVIVDDATHTPAAFAKTVTLRRGTAQLELVYYDAVGGAEVELGWVRPNYVWQLLGVVAKTAPVVRGTVLISEFCADNGSLILDEDGLSADWIEIWNSTTAAVNLTGYFLTDLPGTPDKWALPAWTLAPNAYMVVFASGKDRRPVQAIAGQDNPGTIAQPRLHANFTLPKAGGYLALSKAVAGGGFISPSLFNPYPALGEDGGFGSADFEGYVGYLPTSTPGGLNSRVVAGFVEKPVFTHPRGRYSSSFQLGISTPTPNATIRYTLDGSTPTINTGLLYTSPVTIGATSVVRAIAFRPGWQASDLLTQTFLFLDDIVNQTTATATNLGFPSGTVNGQVFRYPMNLAAVTSGGGNLQSLKNSLAGAPSICMTTDIGNLVNAATGIYSNPGRHGLFWERPASVEYLNPAGASEFQIDCGVRIRGGASRAVGNPKHAFHLYFRGSLYDGNLKYPVFGPTGTNEFNQLDMRCEQNYSWSKDNNSQNSLLREEWSRVTQADMGQPNSRTGYFHLYINGVYWGVFNWEERTEADFGASYFGGTKETFDTVKSAGSSGGYNTEQTDGNIAAWKTLFDECVAIKNDSSETSRTARYLKLQGLNADGTRNLAFPVLLDADNLADFLLVVFYDGSFDAPLSTFLNNASNNWFGVRDRVGTRGFAFFAHDHEHGMDSMGTNSYNRIGPWGAPGATSNNWGQSWASGQYGTRETLIKANPQYLHELLSFSAEYRARFADRVQRHCFNGGALTRAKSLARVEALATQVDTVIHAEAARWGSTGLNRNTWLNTAKSKILEFINNGGVPSPGHPAMVPGDRASIIVQQLKGYVDGAPKPLYPALLSPAFSGAFGGPVPQPHSFNISHGNGGSAVLYYTVNGADPRALGGAIAPGSISAASSAPVTLNNTATVRARSYNAATQVWSALVEAEFLVGALASSANVVISEIHYNPLIADGNAEFIELANVSSSTVDLTNVRFSLGIDFTFPDGFTIPAGGRAVVVSNRTAFQARYPNVPASQIAGEYGVSNVLSNGGEQIVLLSASSVAIQDFIYDDVIGWPLEADGDGPSLVLKRPELKPNPSLGSSWRSSGIMGGTPGIADNLTYAAWAAANAVSDALGSGDLDRDGLPNLYEYGTGTAPNQGLGSEQPVLAIKTIPGFPGEYLTVTFKRRIGREDVAFSVDAGNDLTFGMTAVQTGAIIADGTGGETLTYRHPQATSASAQQFLRVRATRVP